MAIKHSPGCGCCVAGVTTCCQTTTVKPLPLRTANPGGGASYSDTEWDSSYVTGISGTDNTVPANTTVTISVPIGCTDYAVDVEVLDDAGQNVTDGSPGLRIKVGDCLQAQNYLGTQTSPQSDVYEWPTIISQHDADTVGRDTFDGIGNITRPFYGDDYIAYRFYEVFHNAAMNSGIASFRHPPYRFDVSTDAADSVNTRRLPHDAGGLTVQITIETGSYPVEIGLIQVHAGHISCSTITSLAGLPVEQVCDSVPVYTVTDPSSFITNNGPTVSTFYSDGDVVPNIYAVPSCSSTSCTFDYTGSLDISIWTGNHSWYLKRDPSAGYGFFDFSTEATAAQTTELIAYLSKCVSHSWSHADVLVDSRMFRWHEALLDCDQMSISHSLTINGSCNIVEASQTAIDADLNVVHDNYCVPSGGPLTIQLAGQGPCGTIPNAPMFPYWCPGQSQLTWNNIFYRTGVAYQRELKVINTESEIETFFNLAPTFAYPNAGTSANPERDYSFTRSAFNGNYTNVCGATNSIDYGYNAMSIDVTEDATITKIPEYSETDLVYTMQGGRGSGFYVEPLATRDKHLQSLSLYISDETSTFTSANGTVMIPTAVDYSGTRPDYATCGCPCTASTIYSDDLFTTGSPVCVYWHRWMEFTDGTDTWYVKWNQVFGFPSTWTFLFRRESDCKEIEFTGVSSTLPFTVNSVQKTSTNGNGDTLSIEVYS